MPDLLHDDVRNTLVRLSTPIVIGFLANVSIYAVDAYFVSRLGAQVLAGFAYAIPLLTVITTVFLGLGIGVSSVVARDVGAGAGAAALARAWHSAWMAAALAACVWVGMHAAGAPLLSAMGARGLVLDAARTYFVTWLWGVPALGLLHTFTAALRGLGDVLTSGKVLLLASFVNLCLAPVLIFGLGPVPAFGVAGSAMATVGGFACATVVALHVAWRSQLLAQRSFRGAAQSFRAIAAVAAPAAVAQSAIPLGLAAVTAALGTCFGDSVVAAFGVGSRIESLLKVVPFSVAGAVAPFVGQNWGARQHERVQQAVAACRRFALYSGAASWLGFALAADRIAAAFSDDAAIRVALTQFFWVVPAGHAALGANMIAVSAFEAIGAGATSMALTLSRSVLLTVPFTLVGSRYGVPGAFAGVVAANLVAEWFGARALRRAGLIGGRSATPARVSQADGA